MFRGRECERYPGFSFDDIEWGRAGACGVTGGKRGLGCVHKLVEPKNVSFVEGHLPCRNSRNSGWLVVPDLGLGNEYLHLSQKNTER